MCHETQLTTPMAYFEPLVYYAMTSRKSDALFETVRRPFASKINKALCRPPIEVDSPTQLQCVRLQEPDLSSQSSHDITVKVRLTSSTSIKEGISMIVSLVRPDQLPPAASESSRDTIHIIWEELDPVVTLKLYTRSLMTRAKAVPKTLSRVNYKVLLQMKACFWILKSMGLVGCWNVEQKRDLNWAKSNPA